MSTIQQSVPIVLQTIPSIPRDDQGPVFSEPWEAEVFAMTLSLHEQGAFTWKEWTAMLSQSIRQAQQQGDPDPGDPDPGDPDPGDPDPGGPDLGDTYYSHWLTALEHMIVQKRIGSRSQLDQLRNAWGHAARNTPHGQPIELPQQ